MAYGPMTKAHKKKISDALIRAHARRKRRERMGQTKRTGRRTSYKRRGRR